MAHCDARVEALAVFQEAALRHALRFPAARRVAYSTCSLHARENEQVVAAVLAEARALGFELEAALPGWHRRGIPGPGVDEHEAAKLLRTGSCRRPRTCIIFVGGGSMLTCCSSVSADPIEDGTDGFFVALFVRRKAAKKSSSGPPPP